MWEAHFEFEVQGNEFQSILIEVMEKKLLLGIVRISTTELQKLNQTFKENWVDMDQCEASMVSSLMKPQIKVRMKITVGNPIKKVRGLGVVSNRTPRSSRRQVPFFNRADPPVRKGISDIIQYIRNDDLVGLEDYLLFHPDTEEVNSVHPKNGNSPLHEACIERREHALPLLLKVDHIIVDIYNANKNTPLHYFCEHWRSPNYLIPFKLFMKKGANVNAVNCNGETPIFKAIFNQHIRVFLIESLIQNSADLNVSNERGEGILHYAVHLGRADIVDLIISAVPNLEFRGFDGLTPIELARQYNTSEHLKIANHLEQVSKLFSSLEDEGLSEFKSFFAKNKIFPKDIETGISDTKLKEIGMVDTRSRGLILAFCNKIRKESKHKKQSFSNNKLPDRKRSSRSMCFDSNGKGENLGSDQDAFDPQQEPHQNPQIQPLQQSPHHHPLQHSAPNRSSQRRSPQHRSSKRHSLQHHAQPSLQQPLQQIPQQQSPQKKSPQQQSPQRQPPQRQSPQEQSPQPQSPQPQSPQPQSPQPQSPQPQSPQPQYNHLNHNHLNHNHLNRNHLNPTITSTNSKPIISE
eukprot:TRINITY_DN3527_c0_g1_i9.p1 TRINITY_DN3527_c0_g1~~TRINITY_DN3527_c0_g1_i9.p1  ORF type:complete len:576 (+),score=137.24 TRINITY_DN3527_c0_g1_i9:248-1975(+)